MPSVVEDDMSKDEEVVETCGEFGRQSGEISRVTRKSDPQS